jgi:hypothetical protein
MRLEALFSFVFSIIVGKNISKELDEFCCNWKVNDLLKNVSSELGKYVIDNELQHTNDFVVYAPPFSIYFVI